MLLPMAKGWTNVYNQFLVDHKRMNNNMFKLPFLILALCLLVACAPSPQAIETAIAQTQAAWTPVPTQTPQETIAVTVIVTKIVTPTFTSTPIFTATNTNTPTITSLPTLTPTPFGTSGCIDMEINITVPSDNYEAHLIEQRNTYDKKCVRLIYVPENGYYSPKSLVTVIGLSYYRGEIKRDEYTPANVKSPTKYSYVWGIFQAPNILLLRRVEELPVNQYPIDEGLYNVGNDGIAPGVWKSSYAPAETDSCYWARINPQTGAIRENHFGIAGMSVRVYDGDIYEIEGCGSWFYIGP